MHSYAFTTAEFPLFNIIHDFVQQSLGVIWRTRADGTQAFCADTLQCERKRWMVCTHLIGMAGLISDEHYALWVAMYGTQPRATNELMVLDCTLFSNLLTWVHKAKQLNPARFGVGDPTEMQRILAALWSAHVPRSPRITSRTSAG